MTFFLLWSVSLLVKPSSKTLKFSYLREVPDGPFLQVLLLLVSKYLLFFMFSVKMKDSCVLQLLLELITALLKVLNIGRMLVSSVLLIGS